ncbi:MAG: diguanylate cyclase [Acidimicrobiaceae bacterium]|nr:diguanylate cyclase [Acidimicrobiaceae bacterium]
MTTTHDHHDAVTPAGPLDDVGSTPVDPQADDATQASPWRRRIAKTPAGVLAAYCVLLLIVIVAAAAPWLAPYGFNDQDYEAILVGSSSDHWLGTDSFGRDVLSRLMYGARVSLGSAAVAVTVGMSLGVPAGLLAGYFGGRTDGIIMRLVDTLLAFPTIVLAIGVTAMLGVGMTNAMVAVGIVLSPAFARVMRAQTLVVKNRLYVDSARTFSGGSFWIVRRHILPNAVQPVIVLAAHMLGVALLVEASLSFLGLGTPPPNPSWGGMLREASRFLDGLAIQIVAPGLAIAVTLLAINVVGDGLRDALDPRGRVKRLRS